MRRTPEGLVVWRKYRSEIPPIFSCSPGTTKYSGVMTPRIESGIGPRSPNFKISESHGRKQVLRWHCALRLGVRYATAPPPFDFILLLPAAWQYPHRRLPHRCGFPLLSPFAAIVLELYVTARALGAPMPDRFVRLTRVMGRDPGPCGVKRLRLSLLAGLPLHKKPAFFQPTLSDAKYPCIVIASG